MNDTIETRREAYHAALPKSPSRRELILDSLDGRQMTASEIAEELHRLGFVRYYDRNFVAPRLTELESEGLVHTVGKRICKRTGKREAVYERV